MYPGEFAGMLHQRADVLLLGILAPAASLGIYVVAYQTVEPILVLASASGATVLALGHGHPEVERGAVTARLIRETLLSGGLLAVLAAVLAPVLVPLIYGPSFRGLGDAPAHPAAGYRRAVVRPDRDGRPDAPQPARTDGGHLGVVMVLNVSLNLALIPFFGAVGAATASLDLVFDSSRSWRSRSTGGPAGSPSGRSSRGAPMSWTWLRAWSPRSLALWRRPRT